MRSSSSEARPSQVEPCEKYSAEDTEARGVADRGSRCSSEIWCSVCPDGAGAPLASGYAPLVHLPIMRAYVHHPRKAMAAGCLCHVLVVLTFMVSTQAAGKSFMNFGTDVALHLWHEKWKVRLDAVSEGDEVCSYDIAQTPVQAQQTFARLPTGEYKLDIVYNAPDGNMLTLDKIQRMKQLEDSVVGHPDFSRYCLRDNATGSCQPPQSAAMACVPTVAQPNCSWKKASPPGLFQCARPAGCSRDSWSIDEAFLREKVQHYSSASFMVDFPETAFLASASASFGSGSTTSPALRSTFRFGFPLEGFSAASDRPQEQQKLVEAFMKDAYLKQLLAYNNQQGSGDPPFLIGFAGGTLSADATNQLLAQDMAFILLAFLVVLVYCSLVTRSLWIASLALCQIFLTFFSGFILYRILFGSPFFGTFHVMAIFLLLGIGVDDVFVFTDHYAAAAFVDPAYETDEHGRLSWTWKHAGVAMGVTSLTTTVSFLCNASSSFAGIASFGVFAASLIISLYASMLFFWPAVVSFNTAVYSGRPFLCGLADKLDGSCQNTSKEQLQDVEEDRERPEEGVEEDHHSAKKSGLTRFFEDHYSYFILGHRVKILLVFLGVSAALCSMLPKLTTERSLPQLLPSAHPSSQYATVMAQEFVRGGGLFNTQVSLVFGFESSAPLDRTGTDSTGASGRGSVKWNAQWSSGSPALLRGLECWIQLCDSAEVQNPRRKTGGLPAYRMEGCLPRDLKAAVGDARRWENITAGDLNEFKSAVRELLRAQPGALDNSYAEEVGDQVVYRFFKSSIRLTSSQEMEYQTGIELSEAWEAWLQEEMIRGRCAGVPRSFAPFLEAPHFAFFQVQKTLFKEMIQGIGISIAVAFAVLILTTGNIIVGSLAGFTISMILLWVMAMIPIMGWELGLLENIILVMVPGLSVDFTAHLAEAFNQAKYADREHRVVHALEHSGVSIVKGALSTLLAGLVLRLCQIVFFPKFGLMLIFTIVFALLFSLAFFPALMALIGPCGEQGDWHKYISPSLVPEVERKSLRITPVPAGRRSHNIQVSPRKGVEKE